MKNIKWHALFWSFYFFLALTNDLITDPDATFTKEVIFFTTQNIYLFYSLLYFLRRFSSRSRTEAIVSILRLVIIIGVFVGMRYWVRYYFLTTYFEKEYGNLPIKAWLSTCLMWLINYFIYASAYFYFNRPFKSKRTY